MGRPSPAPPRWGRSSCPPAAREPAESRPRARHASRPPRGSSDWQWPRARETSRRKRSWLRRKAAGRSSSAARETGRKEPRATNEMAGRGPRSYSATTLSVSSRAWRARTKLPGRRTWKSTEVPGAAPLASRTNSARGRRASWTGRDPRRGAWSASEMPRRDAWSAAGRAGRQMRRGRSRLCRTAQERSGRRGCTPTVIKFCWQRGVRAGGARHGDGFHHVHASAVAAAREVGDHAGGVASAHAEPARGVGPAGAPAPGGNPGREERRGRGAGEEHLPRRADEGAGGAPSARPKLGLHDETEEETGNRFILSTIRQKVFACEDDRSGRGSVCWGRLDPDLRVSKCSSGGPRTASRTAGNRRRGASGKPACAKGESDWRKRLAEARAFDEARELERRGLTLAPGRGC